MKREDFTAQDGKRISLAVWDEVERPVGVLQIAHGMAEHIGRYDELARFLNGHGIIVAGDDHRAHGLTDADALGLPGEGDLFEKTVRDELDISDMLLARYSLPLVMMGHSYGSFITQRYLTVDASKIAGCILCGSAFMTGAPVAAGAFLSKFRRAGKPGKLFAKMTFDAYDKKLKEAPGAWLNRDKAEVEKYRNDPLCDFVCSNGFYKYFFRGMKTIARAGLNNIPDDLPLFIVSGEADPVGGQGKLVRKLADRYRAAGLNPTVRLYPGARHELIVEQNRAEFFADVQTFLSGCFKCE